MNSNSDLRYLLSLAKQYPNIASAATELINLKAIMSLPKGTEHFITDIHGEYDQFQHILRNGSGSIRRKIDEEYQNTFSQREKKELASLIYYPELKIEEVEHHCENMEEWFEIMLYRLVPIARRSSSKYTRSKTRKSMSPEFAYIMEELLTGRPDIADQEAYYNEIIKSVIETGRAKELIIALCKLIRRLVVDHLHVLGDIYDRGPYPHLIMDDLMAHHSVDIQWGNHDVLWMGAAMGSKVCIANMLRISAKYANLDIIEDAYGINLVPLARLAMTVYADDPCEVFKVDTSTEGYDMRDALLDTKIHKAIAIIEFKLEGQEAKKHPEFEMDDRRLLHKIDYEKGTITLDEGEFELKDKFFPTIDPKDPYKLTTEEDDVMNRLSKAFVRCEKLQRHIRFLYSKGNLYKVFNNNLLYHGCVPMNEDGTFKKIKVYGKECYGKSLYDELEHYARMGYFSLDPVKKQKGIDIMWFLWEGKNSPVFGKKKMTTFERYFLANKDLHKEKKDWYYTLYEDEKVIDSIMAEFGLNLDDDCHIINGHIPVAAKVGESPIKCNGKLYVIDGGFSKAYRSTTGIAGYTLTYNSVGLILAEHEPFESVEAAVANGTDIVSHIEMVHKSGKRLRVMDTDMGKILKQDVEGLEELLRAYRSGRVAERA